MRMLAASALALILLAVILFVVVDPTTWTYRNVSLQTYGVLILLVCIALPYLAAIGGMLDKRERIGP